MYIEAVIVCKDYADFLVHTLMQNVQHLDRIFVVTSYDDLKTQRVCSYFGLKVECIQTDAFTRNGDKFNKALAINEGLARCSQGAWVLHMDADIVLPPMTRVVLENRHFDPTAIYGVDRVMCYGFEDWVKYLCDPSPMHEEYYMVHSRTFEMGTRVAHYNQADGWLPIGFFQFWNPSGSGISRYPEYQDGANHTDLMMSKSFPRGKRHLIPEFFAIHLDSDPTQGFEMGLNWNGRKTPYFGPAPKGSCPQCGKQDGYGLDGNCPTAGCPQKKKFELVASSSAFLTANSGQDLFTSSDEPTISIFSMGFEDPYFESNDSSDGFSGDEHTGDTPLPTINPIKKPLPVDPPEWGPPVMPVIGTDTPVVELPTEPTTPVAPLPQPIEPADPVDPTPGPSDTPVMGHPPVIPPVDVPAPITLPLVPVEPDPEPIDTPIVHPYRPRWDAFDANGNPKPTEPAPVADSSPVPTAAAANPEANQFNATLDPETASLSEGHLWGSYLQGGKTQRSASYPASSQSTQRQRDLQVLGEMSAHLALREQQRRKNTWLILILYVLLVLLYFSLI